MEATAGRETIADYVCARLAFTLQERQDQYAHRRKSRYFVVDDLLPADLATAIHESFPRPTELMLRKSLREMKYVTSQMNRCRPLVEEAVFAFHDPRVVQLITEITRHSRLEADVQLYAGGISMMGREHFLNPHIDNSHDKDRLRYRVLNLLYYVSPGWSREDGGSLELWPEGPQREPITIPSLFNRLVVMATNRSSWHSVSRVGCNRYRTCVSNYYFSPDSPEGEDYFHVTSFRGRPEQRVRDWILRADAAARAIVRKVARQGIVQTKHFYRRE
jgi:Rps23 Pro-64 3,4-dihydroxylase Tpa1-like proline 4-hydroxylase